MHSTIWFFAASGQFCQAGCEFLAGREVRNVLGRHFHAGASLGIAGDARPPLPRAETAKAAKLDPVAGAQSPHQRVEDRFHHNPGLGKGDASRGRDLPNEIRLPHNRLMLLSRAPRRQPPRFGLSRLADSRRAARRFGAGPYLGEAARLLAWWGVTKLIATLLFGVRAADAFTYVAAMLFLLAVALLANS